MADKLAGVLENLASQPSLAETMVRETDIFQWLLKRIQVRESPLSQNKQYAAELLAILLQTSAANRRRLTALDGVDLFLQLLSPYRKRDPVKGGDEEEFVENIFDCVTCVADEADGKLKFVRAEGVELVLIMLREGKMSRPRALRLLDHAVSSVQDATVAIRLVEAAGLKTLFGMFMKKVPADILPSLSLSPLPNPEYSKTLEQPSTSSASLPACCVYCRRTLPSGSVPWQSLSRATTPRFLGCCRFGTTTPPGWAR